MPTTVYFATNRQVINPSDPIGGYPPAIIPPSSPDQMTYGTAFVDDVDIATNAQGVVSQIGSTNKGSFPPQALADLSASGRDMLVFIHGFDNTFSDAITRAAFNREWLAASGEPATDTTVIAFSWPSLGKLVTPPILQADYLTDQTMAQNSGIHLMSFFQAVRPILHANGRRSTLLAHSMGNLALSSGVENWFLHGNAADKMFNVTLLAAADCRYDSFDLPPPGGLSRLSDLSDRISIYYSQVDDVLKLSMVVNFAKRMGQDGPHNMADTTTFPRSIYTMVDCSSYRDYDFNFMTSHQYYRMSPSVRGIIASDMSRNVQPSVAVASAARKRRPRKKAA
ncbi:MAG TPA: alpha/beta hydrolase [Rhodopila sp.]|nr:alpha/beta hydrolase [Rhodopila sp.]